MASVRVLDADMPVDTYPIDSDGNPHGYPYDDHPGGYRDYALELVVGEDAGKVETALRMHHLGETGRIRHSPGPSIDDAGTVCRWFSRMERATSCNSVAILLTVAETECMTIDNPGERVFREGRWRYRNVVTVEVQIFDDDQYEGTEQFYVLNPQADSPGAGQLE